MSCIPYWTIIIAVGVLAFALPGDGKEQSFLKAVHVIPVEDVWTGSSPRFCLLSDGGTQYAAYYDASRQMTVASRNVDADTWKTKKLDDFVSWDSHNYIVMAVDSKGHLHVSGNMHAVPLRYYRTSLPGDVSSLAGVHDMVGTEEKLVTYPRFFTGPNSEFLFTYRDGGSGNGNNIVNIYNPESQEWRRYNDEPFMDGEGKMSAYHFQPLLDRKGDFHAAWCWRDTPDVVTNHDVSYARSVGGLHKWEKSDGTPIALPLTIHNTDIIDRVGTDSGLMNNVQLSFDAHDRPMVSYVKYDPKGRTQLYVMRLEGGRWKRYQSTDWDCRWEFSGMGSIGAKIWFSGPVPWGASNVLAQVFTNLLIAPYAQIRFLDGKTLQPISEPVRLYPAEMDNIRPEDKDVWQMNWVGLNLEDLEREGHTWVLRWKSMRPNRDQPRDSTPPPDRLELVKMVRSE